MSNENGTLRYTVGLNTSISEDVFKRLSRIEQGKLMGYYVCVFCECWFSSQGQLDRHVCEAAYV